MRRLVVIGWLAIAASLPAACGGATPDVTSPATPEPSATQSASPTSTPSPTATLTLTPSASPTPYGGVPAFKHMFLIVMENKEQASVIGSPDAPYLNQLAGKYAVAARFYATSHPSLPNYLALIGGDTFHITSDCTDCFRDADNLADQITAVGRTWKGYMEDMPQPCTVGNHLPLYAQKHDPFIYFDSLRNNPAQCGRIVPFSEFAGDLQADSLPDFSWITPNLCDDMHDCPVSTGDDWLQSWVPQILSSQAWQDQGVLFITFDEGSTNVGCCSYAHGGNIATLVISPLARPGFVSQVAYNHYSLLRTIETAWGLPLLGHAGCDCTPLMSDFFSSP